jgi:hypothetical protein
MADKKLPNEIALYMAADGSMQLDVRIDAETVWLTQRQMAELFNTTPQNITIHLKNIYEDGELEEEATCKDFLQVQKESGRKVERKLRHFNLDAIIGVGYRVNSKRGTQFRIWATTMLREHLSTHENQSISKSSSPSQFAKRCDIVTA